MLNIAAERFERRLSEDVGRLRVDLIKEIHDGRSETIRCLQAFWLGQFFAFAGLLAFMLPFTAPPEPRRRPRRVTRQPRRVAS